MNRWLSKVMIIVATAVLVAVLAAGALAANPPKLVVNGRLLEPDVPPEIVDGRVMVPVRWVAEALGAKVDWIEETRTVEVQAADGQSEANRSRLLESALAPQTAEEAAVRWAEAVRSRNGALEYAMLAPSLRDAGRYAPGWVTGVSSPLVEGYTIEHEPLAWTSSTVGVLSEGPLAFTVRFSWWTSSGASESSSTAIEVARFPDLPGSPWLVTSVKPIAAGDVAGSGSPAQEGTAELGSVPFLSVEKPTVYAETGRYAVWNRLWDLDRGLVGFGGMRFEFMDSSKRGVASVAWDGGERLVLVQTEAGIEVGDNTPGGPAAVETLAVGSLLDMVSAPGDRDETAVVKRDPVNGDMSLQIRGAGGVTEIPLTGPVQGADLLRPVAVTWDGDRVRVYCETSKSGPQGLVTGLAEATYSDGRISWRTISQDLGISEAGAGTNMVKLGNAIFVGRQEGTVMKVDLATGKIEECKQINERLALFAQRFANRVECCVPPALYAYGDTLIVSWEPAALREQLMGDQLIDQIVGVRCLLAVRNGEVVGRAETSEGKTTVLRGDTVTQTIVSRPQGIEQWIFPH